MMQLIIKFKLVLLGLSDNFNHPRVFHLIVTLFMLFYLLFVICYLLFVICYYVICLCYVLFLGR